MNAEDEHPSVAERLTRVEQLLSTAESRLQERAAPQRTIKVVREAQQDVRRVADLLGSS